MYLPCVKTTRGLNKIECESMTADCIQCVCCSCYFNVKKTQANEKLSTSVTHHLISPFSFPCFILFFLSCNFWITYIISSRVNPLTNWNNHVDICGLGINSDMFFTKSSKDSIMRKKIIFDPHFIPSIFLLKSLKSLLPRLSTVHTILEGKFENFCVVL